MRLQTSCNDGVNQGAVEIQALLVHLGKKQRLDSRNIVMTWCFMTALVSYHQ